MNLFESTTKNYEPLASRMRPRTLGEYIGQDHILGPGRLLRRSIEADKLTSVIFSGPPGTGKTTLARVIAQATKGAFLSVNAVLSGVKEIRELIEKAQEIRQVQGRKTILFVDEVHRWNKSQQDALLPWVENGTFVLIGATTENPFFEVNAALVSRSRVFTLLPLKEAELADIAAQAVGDPERGYGKFLVRWEPGALEHLVKMASGDARSLLNALELAVESSVTPFPPPPGTVIAIGLSAAEESTQKKAVLYDKDGDYHFDSISAFIKSLRGSDPDASLYWLARMVRAGEDPGFLLRRMLILASEDVGLADPQALVVVQAAAEAFRRVGLPEGQYHLAQAALYLATCPKSNSTSGYFEALKLLETEHDGEVPVDLKDASRDGEALGHGKGYLYPHSFRDHWVSQQYLPRSLKSQVFYSPSHQGYEGTLRGQILERRSMLLSQHEVAEDTGNLTWTKASQTPWLARLERDDAGPLTGLRNAVMARAALYRHSRVWIANDPRGIFLYPALAATPEGHVVVSCRDTHHLQQLSDQVSFLPELQRPHLLLPGTESSPWLESSDFVLAWGLQNMTPGSVSNRLVVETADLEGPRLTPWIPATAVSDEERSQLAVLEDRFLGSRDRRESLEISGYAVEVFSTFDRRVLSPASWNTWWTPGRVGSWPEFVLLSDPSAEPLLARIAGNPPQDAVDWRFSWYIAFQKKGASA